MTHTTLAVPGVVVCLTFALSAAADAQTLTGTEQRVTTAAADQFDPALSNDIVVYTDFSGIDADIWYTDLSTGLANPVSMASGDQQLTGVSANRIVFTDWNTMDVLVFDVTTGVTTNLTNAAGSNSVDPAIDHNLVAWTDDRDGNSEIYARDLSTGEERRLTNDPLMDEAPAVGDGLVVWERCDIYVCDVFAYDWTSGVTAQVTATPSFSERLPDVSGRIVVFQREQGTPVDKNVVAYNLDTWMEAELPLPGDQENAHVSGEFVEFNDSSSGVSHVGLWQLSTGAHFNVTEGAIGQYLGDIDGHRIVYSDNRSGSLDIYLFDFQVDMPPADTQAPVIHGAADLAVDATSPQGAVVSFPVFATDDTDPAPMLVCTPASGSMFPIMVTPVTCTATDTSGNSATAYFSVSVRGADMQLGSLADLVASLNLRQGIENSLDAKLNAALAALDAARAGAVGTACNQLVAFINEVKAQTGKAISAADAAALLQIAARIRAVLGCA